MGGRPRAAASPRACPFLNMSVRTADPTRTRRRADRWTLAVVLLGFLTLPMSMSGAGVAVPRIAADLGAEGPAAQWVVTAYFLTASSFMLVAGSLGDAVGRRRIYRIGALAYTIGSLAAALAPTIALLLTARVVTGLGAAGVMAGGGALLGATFTGPARTRAFAAMGTTGGLGLALGPTLSGLLIDSVGWRVGFGVFAIAGAILLVGTRLLRETRAQTRPRIDLAGAATFILCLAALMLAVTQGADHGWGAPEVVALLAAAVVLFLGFVLIERRATNPVLDLSLLRRRRFIGWLLAATTMSAGFVGILSFLPSYLQDPAGYTAAQAGLVMILPTLPMMLMPLAGSRLINRGVPPALLATVALLAIAGGNAWLAILHPAVTPLDLAGPLILTGTGVGLASGIIDAQAMNEVTENQVGMAAGMLNTVRGAANALGLAIFGSALIAILASRIGSTSLAGQATTGNIPDTTEAAFLGEQLTETWRVVLLIIAGLCLAAATGTGVLLRHRHGRRSTQGRLATPSH